MGMDNRGFLRILEAVVAIMIVISVLFIFYNNQRVQTSPNYGERAAEILNELAQEPTIREMILEYEGDSCNIETPIPTEVSDFIQERIPESFLQFEARICPLNEACGKCSFLDAEIFSAERTISSTIEVKGPKKVRLFIWRIQ